MTIVPLRAKSLPCYGYDKNTAPNLCDFARESFLFKNSYSQSSYTLDNRFSILTSLLPSTHKMNVPYVSILSNQIVTLPEILKKNGYITMYAGTIGDYNQPLDKGLGRGFDYIESAEDPWSWIGALNKDIKGKQKFFALLHTYWVHQPYVPQKEDIKRFYNGPVTKYITYGDICEKTYNLLVKLHPERFNNLLPKNSTISQYCSVLNTYYNKYVSLSFDQNEQFWNEKIDSWWSLFADIEPDEKRKYIQALYDTKIYELDLEMEKFFQYLKDKNLMRNTIVIVTADHGEELQEHGHWSHGADLYNEQIHVPLIVYVPGAKPQKLDKLAESIDIAPSIFHLLGLNLSKQFQGNDLFSFVDNKYVISQRPSIGKQSILTKEWKLILNQDFNKNITLELYNLKKDYNEKKNVVSDNPNIVASLYKNLNTILERQPLYYQKNNQPFPTWINQEERKKLIQTGYF